MNAAVPRGRGLRRTRRLARAGRAFDPRHLPSAPCNVNIVCEVIEGAGPNERRGDPEPGGKAERPGTAQRLNGDPQGPDPGNAGEGRPPRRPFSFCPGCRSFRVGETTVTPTWPRSGAEHDAGVTFIVRWRGTFGTIWLGLFAALPSSAWTGPAAIDEDCGPGREVHADLDVVGVEPPEPLLPRAGEEAQHGAARDQRQQEHGGVGEQLGHGLAPQGLGEVEGLALADGRLEHGRAGFQAPVVR